MFTHHNTYAISREASSETYAPWVYLLSYLLSIYFILNFEFELSLNQREISNSNSGDMASLADDYCSLIIQASQRPREVDRLQRASTAITPHMDRYPACF